MYEHRVGLGVAVALAVALAWVAQSPAHGGDLVGSATAGPYLVELYSAVTTAGGGAGIDYTAYLRGRETGFPVDDARVEMTVIRPNGERLGPARARGFANGYDVVVEVEDPAERSRHRVVVAITGPRGRASAEIDVSVPGAGPAPAGSRPWLWAVAGAAGAAGLGLLVVGSVRGDRNGGRRGLPRRSGESVEPGFGSGTTGVLGARGTNAPANRRRKDGTVGGVDETGGEARRGDGLGNGGAGRHEEGG